MPNLADIPNVPNSNSVHSVSDVPVVSTDSVGTNLSHLPLSSIDLSDSLGSNGLHVPISSSSAAGGRAKKADHADVVLNADASGETNVFLESIGHDIDLDGDKDEPVQIEGALSESSEEEDSDDSMGI